MDETTQARQLRLAVITNVFHQGLLTEDEAKSLLNANLSPDDASTFYDDSSLLGDGRALEKIAEECNANVG